MKKDKQLTTDTKKYGQKNPAPNIIPSKKTPMAIKKEMEKKE